MPSVNVQFRLNPNGLKYLPRVNDFQRWANAVSEANSPLSVRIVDLEECIKLNQKYRQINRPSNVLSFPFDPQIETEQNYLGDIVMTAPMILQEAQEQQKSARDHWAHLFIHGVLHLTGYRHDTENQAKQMEAQESKIMKKLGFPDPWNES